MAPVSNPVLFAAVAVIAVGIVVYEVVSRYRQRRHEYGRRRSSSPPPKSPPPSPPKSRPKSVSAGSQKTIRKRKLDESNQEPTPSNSSKSSDLVPSVTSSDLPNSNRNGNREEVCKISKDEEGNLPVNACNQNVDNKKFDEKNYEKNVFDNIMSETKYMGKKTEILIKNVDEEDSDSSEENIPQKVEEKLTNLVAACQPNTSSGDSVDMEITNRVTELQSTASSSLDHEECLIQNFEVVECQPNLSSRDSVDMELINQVTELQSPAGSSLDSEECFHQNLDSWDLVSSSIDPEEEMMYKEKVCSNLKNEVDSKGKAWPEKLGSSNTNSGCAVGNDLCAESSNLNSIPNTKESSICRGCEENRVNTRAEPCNHQYLCLDCATKVLRLYNKCSICHYEIKEFKLL